MLCSTGSLSLVRIGGRGIKRVRTSVTHVFLRVVNLSGAAMNEYKCVLEIWLVYRRIGTYIVPDLWDVTIPTPVQFNNHGWNTDILPVRCHEA